MRTEGRHESANERASDEAGHPWHQRGLHGRQRTQTTRTFVGTDSVSYVAVPDYREGHYLFSGICHKRKKAQAPIRNAKRENSQTPNFVTAILT